MGVRTRELSALLRSDRASLGQAWGAARSFCLPGHALLCAVIFLPCFHSALRLAGPRAGCATQVHTELCEHSRRTRCSQAQLDAMRYPGLRGLLSSSLARGRCCCSPGITPFSDGLSNSSQKWSQVHELHHQRNAVS